MRVGYLGPAGTFSEEALRTDPRLPAGAELVPLPTVHRVMLWNGSLLAQVGGDFGSTIECVAVMTNANSVGGGSFLTAGGTPVNSLAAGNGQAWEARPIRWAVGGVWRDALRGVPSGRAVRGDARGTPSDSAAPRPAASGGDCHTGAPECAPPRI